MRQTHKARHLQILELIATSQIHTQEELVDALAGSGWKVTQSSISRDITALGLAKIDGVYHRPLPGALTAVDPNELRLREGVLRSDVAAGGLVVVRTLPGVASVVAIAIDRLAWPDCVGTIAGDDTIFIATRDRTGQRRVLSQLRALSGERK